jgi:hypothetical protein
MQEVQGGGWNERITAGRQGFAGAGHGQKGNNGRRQPCRIGREPHRAVRTELIERRTAVGEGAAGFLCRLLRLRLGGFFATTAFLCIGRHLLDGGKRFCQFQDVAAPTRRRHQEQPTNQQQRAECDSHDTLLLARAALVSTALSIQNSRSSVTAMRPPKHTSTSLPRSRRRWW